MYMCHLSGSYGTQAALPDVLHMYICMDLHEFIYIYVCMHVFCMYVYMYVRIYVYMYVGMYACTQEWLWVCKYVSM